MIKSKLTNYRVILLEEVGDKFNIVFDCMAKDNDHAVEQAEDAYPGCVILHYFPFFEEVSSKLDEDYLICDDVKIENDSQHQDSVIVLDSLGDRYSDMLFVGEVGVSAYILVKDQNNQGSLVVKIKRDEEGVVVDIFSSGQEDGDCLTSTYAFYAEYKNEDNID